MAWTARAYVYIYPIIHWSAHFSTSVARPILSQLTFCIMASCKYEPLPRYRHVAQRIGSRLLLHGGRTKDFSEKRRKQLTTVVEIFNPYFESWEQKQVNGDELIPGTYASASASLRADLYTFGGLNASTPNKESNALHRLDTKTWRWHILSPHGAEGAPLPKFGCGMVAFSSEYLGVFGGHALPPSKPVVGSFIKNSDQLDGSGWTNEFHIFNLMKGMFNFTIIMRGNIVYHGFTTTIILLLYCYAEFCDVCQ